MSEPPIDDAFPTQRASRIPKSNLPRIEFRKSQRKDLTYYAAAFLAAALSWLARLTPDAFENFIALRIGDLSFLTSRQWRANVESNIAHVIDQSEESAVVRRTTRSIFQTNALNVATLLRSPHQSRQELLASLTFPHGDWEVLAEASARGQGVIILTAHLGSFDTMGSAVAAKGYSIAALTARTTSRFAFEFVSFLRLAHRLQLIEASSSGVREAIAHLRAGNVLCLLSDRDFFLNGQRIEFFGEETTLPIGAARLARDTGATIVPIFAVRQQHGHALMIEPSFTVEKTANRDADVERAMKRVVGAMEHAISNAPDQWVMFQRVWPEETPIVTG
ncbi:MAG TPA: lysophospholipid acyltransferase family protein [Thermomicrobiales bacterium]|nr:lysophospholipid acyltransferase family protein [Thermomicrobiales bacterium]